MAKNNNLGELLPIRENNGQRAVNARDLHSFLESKQQFADWIKGRISKYDFVEGKDFETLYFDYQGNLLNIRHHNFMKSENQQVSKIEYALSISMAKELSMLENNERGKQARKYFIACEENKHELSRKELALMVVQAEEEKERLLLENSHLSETVNMQTEELQKSAPKVSYYDNHLQSVNTQTSTQAAKQIGMDAEKLHKKLKEIGIIYRQSGQWILHAPYSTWGMHSTRTQTYTRSDGSVGTSVYTVWTTKGVRFIIALYESDWDVKKAVKQIKGELEPAA